MATAYNRVVLLGNLTSQPEIKNTATGTEVCNFSIAVNRRFAKQGEQSVDYINIVAFKHNAIFVSKYFGKGSQILVSGSIQTRNYTNSQGQKVYVTEVVADEVVGLGKSNTQSNEPRVSVPPSASGNNYTPSAYGAPNFAQSSANFEEIPDSDGLPF
jgi:single-strand DNA-binding protein